MSRELALEMVMRQLEGVIGSSRLFNESEQEEVKDELEDVKDKIDKEVKTPEDVAKFVDKNDKKVQEKIKGDSMLSKGWDLLKKILKMGAAGLGWIIDHWAVVLTIIVCVYLYMFGLGGIMKIFGFGIKKGIESSVNALADGFAALTGPEYMAAGEKISDACVAAGGYGGWSMAGLGGGLR